MAGGSQVVGWPQSLVGVNKMLDPQVEARIEIEKLGNEILRGNAVECRCPACGDKCTGYDTEIKAKESWIFVELSAIYERLLTHELAVVVEERKKDREFIEYVLKCAKNIVENKKMQDEYAFIPPMLQLYKLRTETEVYLKSLPQSQKE